MVKEKYKTEKSGFICCNCGKIFIAESVDDDVEYWASLCCDGEIEFGYLQKDNKTFISD